ncbi:MAG: hypothetical protein EA388_04080 [Nitriliruptor sp.]|nr:MAG: hypothetical protein EA388_04080 [Nitriliruptor sp.]
MLAAVGLALVGSTAWLVVLVVVLQVLTLGAGALTVMTAIRELPRHVDQRLERLEAEVADGLDRVEGASDQAVVRMLRDDAFLQDLRSLALPQEQIEQVLRIIEAGNARLEAGIDQVNQRLDDSSGRSTARQL